MPFVWWAVVWAGVAALCLFAALAWVMQQWQAIDRAAHTRFVWILLGALLTSSLANSLIGMAQFFNAVPVAWSPWITASDSARAFGNLRQPNQLATLCSMGLGIAVFLPRPRSIPPSRAGRWAWRIFLGAALFVLAFATAVSASRTGLLQWLLLACALAYWAWRQPANYPALWRGLFALAVYALISIALAKAWLDPTGLHGSFAAHTAPISGTAEQAALGRLGDSSSDARVALWSNVLQVIGARPWLGWGWGNLPYAMVQTPLHGAIFSTELDNAHNLPLQLAAELGLPFALLFCGLVLLWVWRRKPWAERDAARQAAWLILAAVALHSLLEYPLWYAPFLFASALAFGLLLPHTSADSAPAPTRIAPPSKHLHTGVRLLGALTILLALCAWVDWMRVAQIYLPDNERSAWLTDGDDWIEENARSFWFDQYAEFAQMSTIDLNANTAAAALLQADHLLRYSSEARVLRRARDAAALLGRGDLAAQYQAQLDRRWPAEAARCRRTPQPADC